MQKRAIGGKALPPNLWPTNQNNQTARKTDPKMALCV